MSRPDQDDTSAMGRVFLFILLVGAGWFLLNIIGVSIDPRGVGTEIQGREVIRDADDLEARFNAIGSLRESYMLFGGDAQQRRNSIVHATAAGLPIRNARSIASVYPDFHMCKSPGAKQAMQLTQNLSFVAADRAALNALVDAVDLFEKRLGAGGERTCIGVSGAPISLKSVHLVENDADITRDVAPALNEFKLILAQSVEIQDCQSLLR
jgi:hypothetical protein